MKNFMAALVMFCIALQCVKLAAEQKKSEAVETLSGRSIKLLQTAIPVLNSFGISMDGYKIIILTAQGKPTIILEDENAKSGQYGTSQAAKPSFEIQFNEDGSRVIKANFSR
jgi:hypothetical protein